MIKNFSQNSRSYEIGRKQGLPNLFTPQVNRHIVNKFEHKYTLLDIKILTKRSIIRPREYKTVKRVEVIF